MKNLSHDIQQYILDLFEDEEENFISLRRKELAEMFECVPSQINYVLRSRFTPAHGYLIESRRGEYGYIKIVKISCCDPKEKAQHVRKLIGDGISLHEAHRLLETLQEREFITQRERLLIEIALEHVDEENSRNQKKLARVLEKMLSVLMTEE